MNETRLGREIVEDDVYDDGYPQRVISIGRTIQGCINAYVSTTSGYKHLTIEADFAYLWCGKHRRFSIHTPCIGCAGEALLGDSELPALGTAYVCGTCGRRLPTREEAIECCPPVEVDSWLCGQLCVSPDDHPTAMSAIECILEAQGRPTG